MALMALPPPRLPGAGLVLRQAFIQHSTLSCAGRRLQRSWPCGKAVVRVCSEPCARVRTPAGHPSRSRCALNRRGRTNASRPHARYRAGHLGEAKTPTGLRVDLALRVMHYLADAAGCACSGTHTHACCDLPATWQS